MFKAYGTFFENWNYDHPLYYIFSTSLQQLQKCAGEAETPFLLGPHMPKIPQLDTIEEDSQITSMPLEMATGQPPDDGTPCGLVKAAMDDTSLSSIQRMY
uniref:Mediator of RNA polymerase II transcription subunit 6 n=1 Tax=Steinernema glaseri TaxID=37863 RepID=A0A1I7Z6E5_9BILA